MRRTNTIQKNRKTYFHDSFESIEEFYSAVAAEPIEPTTGDSATALRGLSCDNESFRGLSNKKILEYKHGYPEGVEALSLLPELNIKKGGVKYAHKWDDNDGDDMSLERYYDGMACMRKRYKTTGDNQQGRFVEIKVKIDENCDVNYKKMLWKTYTACRIIDQLEDQGIRVKVTICMRSDIYWSGIDVAVLDIVVKDFNQPLNISLLANVCSPWFFRYWVFMYIAKTKPLTGTGYGTANAFATSGWSGDEITDRKDLIQIDTGQCLSGDSAEEFIKALEI
jgi:hypothetical protein